MQKILINLSIFLIKRHFNKSNNLIYEIKIELERKIYEN